VAVEMEVVKKGFCRHGRGPTYRQRRGGSWWDHVHGDPPPAATWLGRDGGSHRVVQELCPERLTCGATGRFKRSSLIVAHGPGSFQYSNEFSIYSNCLQFVNYQIQSSIAPKFAKLCKMVV
jgi:hypothetical protein